MKDTVLVTGGAGFIGSNIVKKLLEEGFEVKVLDNFLTGKRENIIPFIDRILLYEGDVRDLNIVKEAMEKVDFVLHQAALPSVVRSIENPSLTTDINIMGTLNILKVAKEEKVKRVIFASSSSVYGDSEILPKKEGFCPNPLSPYALTKLTGEKYCKIFYDIYNLETISLRYFNVFGPRQNPRSQYAAVIPKFIKKIMNDENPVIYGDGLQTRDFTYIDNVVYANLLAMGKNRTKGEVVNIACGRRHNLLELVEEINRILGRRIEPIFAPPRPGDVKHSLADISLAKEVLGYEPKVHFYEGLKKTIEWYKNT